MDSAAVKKEVLAVLKGAFSAALMYGMLGFLNYVGAHVPALFQFTCSIAAAWGTVRKIS